MWYFSVVYTLIIFDTFDLIYVLLWCHQNKSWRNLCKWFPPDRDIKCQNHKCFWNLRQLLLIINFFHQTACDEPDIPGNGSLHSTSRSRYPNGNYPKHTEAIFQYQTGNGTALLHSFCKDGNWTGPMYLNGINSSPFNHQSIPTKTCEVSPNYIKIIALDPECWSMRKTNQILCKI